MHGGAFATSAERWEPAFVASLVLGRFFRAAQGSAGSGARNIASFLTWCFRLTRGLGLLAREFNFARVRARVKRLG